MAITINLKDGGNANYPLVDNLISEISRIRTNCELTINGKGIFGKYEDIEITVNPEFTEFKVCADKYVFDYMKTVIRNDSIERYEIKVG